MRILRISFHISIRVSAEQISQLRKDCREHSPQKKERQHRREQQSWQMKPFDQSRADHAHDETSEHDGVHERQRSERRQHHLLAPREARRRCSRFTANDAAQTFAPPRAGAFHQVRHPQPLTEKIIAIQFDQRVRVEGHVQHAAAEKDEGQVRRQRVRREHQPRQQRQCPDQQLPVHARRNHPQTPTALRNQVQPGNVAVQRRQNVINQQRADFCRASAERFARQPVRKLVRDADEQSGDHYRHIMLAQNVARVACDFCAVQQGQQRRQNHHHQRANEKLRRPHPTQHADHPRKQRIGIKEAEAPIKLRAQRLFRQWMTCAAFAREDAACLQPREKFRQCRERQRPASLSLEFRTDGSRCCAKPLQHVMFRCTQQQITPDRRRADDE